MRVGGTILILLGLIPFIILDWFVLNNDFLYILLLIITLPWFILITLLKLEVDYLVDNARKSTFVFIMISIILIIGGILISIPDPTVLSFAFLAISNILIVLSWHFALSIYKKEKIFFVLGGSIYCIVSFIFRMNILLIQVGWILTLFPLVFIIIGICLIVLAEMRMKKKGLLNYI